MNTTILKTENHESDRPATSDAPRRMASRVGKRRKWRMSPNR